MENRPRWRNSIKQVNSKDGHKMVFLNEYVIALKIARNKLYYWAGETKFLPPVVIENKFKFKSHNRV